MNLFINLLYLAALVFGIILYPIILPKLGNVRQKIVQKKLLKKDKNK